MLGIILFTLLSILEDNKIPIIIKIKVKRNEYIIDKLFIISLTDSGIKEKTDIDIITPLDIDKQLAIIVSLFLSLKKHGITPKMVESPAKVVIRNGNIILFILNAIQKFIEICYFKINILLILKIINGRSTMNYDLKMEEQIKNIKPGATLLLHACCAPCSSAVIERLGNIFAITILFYNPNITDSLEYNKRLLEIEKFIKKIKTTYPINLICGRYDQKEFFDIATGLEKEKERGKRCYKCYKLRLTETAIIAKKNNFDFFTTTLSISPYKNSIWLNEIGEDLANEYNATYLYADFKKRNGYKRSIELSKEYNLYRQDFCGCIYSKENRYADKL